MESEAQEMSPHTHRYVHAPQREEKRVAPVEQGQDTYPHEKQGRAGAHSPGSRAYV